MLLAVYVVLSLFNDPRAYLGTDTGGKVATLEVMTERGRLDPDIGYWAEQWDPTGRVHPLFYTSHVGDRWVNATTLPVLYAAYPLYAVGGYRLALLLPMLGSVLAALAARALARRLGAGDGWPAFWIVGLASPMTIYALDFWEHSIGVAAMAWAVVLLLDVAERRRRAPAAVAAGALFGAAATLRTEALVYAFIAVLLTVAVLAVARRELVAAVVTGVGAAVGLVGPLAANVALEVATVGEPIRWARASGTAAAAVDVAVGAGAQVGQSRVEEALLYAVGLDPALRPSSYLIGLALVALLAFAAWRATRGADQGPAVVAAGGVGALYGVRFAGRPGFVPGLAPATPLAVVGLVHGWSSRSGRFLLAVGAVPLPLVWATEFLGGAPPQWGARYILLSGLLFTVVGVVALPLLPAWARTGAVALAVVVTAFGLAWVSIRTNSFGAAAAALNRRDEPVLVSRVEHLAREGGVFYGERRWLTASSDADQRFAVEVLERAGVRRFGLVELVEEAQRRAIPGWVAVRSEELPLVYDVRLKFTTYERA